MKHLLITNHHYQSLLEGYQRYLYTRGYARSTCYNLPHHVREFLHFLENKGIPALAQVETTDLEAFLAYLENRHHTRLGGALSAGHLNKYLQALKRFAAYLDEVEGLLLRLPVLAYKQSRVPKLLLTQAEVEALYAACSRDALGQRDRAMLSLYYGCGLRREEGERLNLADFQAERNLLYVKAGKTGRDRYVPLTERVKADLLHYRERGRAFLIRSGEPKAFLIRSPGQRIQGASLNLRLKRLVLKSGIGKDIGLHSLRHSIATHLWQAGMSLEQVGQFLGHTSLESTQIYTHLSRSEEEPV